MPVFDSSEQLYAQFGELIDRIAQTYPQATETLLKSKMSFCFHLSDPAGTLVIDATKRPFSVQYGATSPKAMLDVSLSGDTLHQILLGELSLTKAVGQKRVIPKGPVWKVMALADLFHYAKQIYPDMVTASRK